MRYNPTAINTKSSLGRDRRFSTKEIITRAPSLSISASHVADKQEEDAEIDKRNSDDEDGNTRRRRYSNSSRESSPDLRGRPRSRSRSISSAGSRYVSRSPSRSRSRSRSGSVDGEEGDTRGRYISRSPSISPDRVLDMAGEDDGKLDGDV